MAETTPPAGEQGPRDPDQIEREIEQTREELADTVAAVADKADVKKQARAKVEETKERAKAKVTGAKEAAEAKKDEIFSGGAEAGTGEAADSGQASQYAQQVQAYARENPVQAATAGALAVGFVLGWIWGRR